MTVSLPTLATSARVRTVAARVAAGAVITLLLAAVAVLVALPRITHGAALTVLSGSMAPELPVGSVVLVRAADPATLRVGDVATYRQDGTANLVTHRIVAIERGPTLRFTFRGDANPVADPRPVPSSAILGKVWFDVPYLGSVRDRLGNRRSLVVISGVLCLSLFSVWQFAAVWRDRRRSGR